MIGIIYKFTIVAKVTLDEHKPFYIGQHWEPVSVEHFLSRKSDYWGSGSLWREQISILKITNLTNWHNFIKREILFVSEKVTQNELDDLEEYYIKKEHAHYSEKQGGCNILWGTSYGWAGAPSKDPIVKKKISEAQKKQVWSEQRRKEMSEIQKRRFKEHPELRIQLSKINKKRTGENAPMYGKHHSEETKEKLRKANLGKKQSKETIEKVVSKISGENHWTKKKKFSNESREKMRISHIGKHHNKETKEKMSFSHKDYYETHSGHWRGKKMPQSANEKRSKSLKEYYKTHNNPMLGKHQSDKTRKLLSEKCFGRVWINNGVKQTYLKIGLELPDGWQFGMLK